MKHIRWGDNDSYFGPFTYAKDKRDGRSLAVVLGSGDEEYPGCRIRLGVLGHTLICALPPIIQPWKRKVVALSWDDATMIWTASISGRSQTKRRGESLVLGPHGGRRRKHVRHALSPSTTSTEKL